MMCMSEKVSFSRYRSPRSLLNTRQLVRQRLHPELVPAKPELGNDTSTAPGLCASIRDADGSRLVGELVELQLRLMTHFLWQGGVSCNVFEGTTDEFVGLDGLTCRHVAKDSCVWSDWHGVCVCVCVYRCADAVVGGRKCR